MKMQKKIKIFARSIPVLKFQAARVVKSEDKIGRNHCRVENIDPQYVVIVSDSRNFVEKPAEITDQNQRHEEQALAGRVLDSDGFDEGKRPAGAEADHHDRFKNVEIIHAAVLFEMRQKLSLIRGRFRCDERVREFVERIGRFADFLSSARSAHLFREFCETGFRFMDFLFAVFGKRDVHTAAVCFAAVSGEETALDKVFDHSADSRAGDIERFRDGFQHDAFRRDRGGFDVDDAHQPHLLDGQIPVFPVVLDGNAAAHVAHEVGQGKNSFPESSCDFV